MRKLIALLVVSVCLFLLSYVATRYTVAQIVEKSIGTPECSDFNDAQGKPCKELKCKFTNPDTPGNFESCESSGGGQSFAVNKCKFNSCAQSTDSLTCVISPPTGNQISYSY